MQLSFGSVLAVADLPKVVVAQNVDTVGQCGFRFLAWVAPNRENVLVRLILLRQAPDS